MRRLAPAREERTMEIVIAAALVAVGAIGAALV